MGAHAEAKHKHAHSLVYWGDFNCLLNTNERSGGDTIYRTEV